MIRRPTGPVSALDADLSILFARTNDQSINVEDFQATSYHPYFTSSHLNATALFVSLPRLVTIYAFHSTEVSPLSLHRGPNHE